jgi:hypothetical protein
MQLDDRLLVLAECGGSFSLRTLPRPVSEGLSRHHKKPTPVAPKPERFLICGHSSKLAFALRELDSYVAPGSLAVLLPGVSEETIQAELKPVIDTSRMCSSRCCLHKVQLSLTNLSFRYAPGDPTLPDALPLVCSAEDFPPCILYASPTN